MHADSELPENTFGLLSKFEKNGMRVGTFLLGFDLQLSEIQALL
jgi:hypothetical protein